MDAIVVLQAYLKGHRVLGRITEAEELRVGDTVLNRKVIAILSTSFANELGGSQAVLIASQWE